MIPQGEFILKIQPQLLSTEAVPVALLTNADKSFMTTVPLAIIGHAIPEGALRVFYHATFDAGHLTLDRVAPAQDW